MIEILTSINADPTDLEVEYTANRGLTLYWQSGCSNDDPDLYDELLESLSLLLDQKGCFEIHEGEIESMDLTMKFKDGAWQLEGQRYICNIVEEKLRL